MSYIGIELRQTLIGSDLGTLIGENVFHMEMPPADPEMPKAYLPCVVYRLISSPALYTHDGNSDLYNPRYQFSIVADSDEMLQGVTDALIAALDGWDRDVEVQSIADDAFDEDTHLWHGTVDATFWHGRN